MYPIDLERDLKLLEQAVSRLPPSFLAEGQEALDRVAHELLFLMTEKLILTSKPTVPPPPEQAQHECHSIEGSLLGFCEVCGKSL